MCIYYVWRLLAYTKALKDWRRRRWEGDKDGYKKRTDRSTVLMQHFNSLTDAVLVMRGLDEPEVLAKCPSQWRKPSVNVISFHHGWVGGWAVDTSLIVPDRGYIYLLMSLPVTLTTPQSISIIKLQVTATCCCSWCSTSVVKSQAAPAIL